MKISHFWPKSKASFSALGQSLVTNQPNSKCGHLSPKYQGYSLTFWPKVAHFDHFSIFNENQAISNLVICHQKYQGYSLGILVKNGSFSSLLNLQSKSINFKFEVICHQSDEGYEPYFLAKK